MLGRRSSSLMRMVMYPDIWLCRLGKRENTRVRFSPTVPLSSEASVLPFSPSDNTCSSPSLTGVTLFSSQTPCYAHFELRNHAFKVSTLVLGHPSKAPAPVCRLLLRRPQTYYPLLAIETGMIVLALLEPWIITCFPWFCRI